MTKLCQIIAIANGTKGRTQKSISDIYHKLQKKELLQGISRKYQPRDDEGEQLPPESNKVRCTVRESIEEFTSSLCNLFNIVATQDLANTKAKADVRVDGQVVLADVPVTTLLFLEKQLVDIGTFASKIPTLETSEEWSYSEEADCYATPAQKSLRTKKVYKNHVKAEATEHHPAQVEVFTEDVVVGEWSTVKFSGAIPQSKKHEIETRVRKLQDAVKMAREEANSIEVTDVKIGPAVFDFLFETSASSA